MAAVLEARWRRIVRRTIKAALSLVFVVAVVLVGFRVAAALRERSDPQDVAPAEGRFVDLGGVDAGGLHLFIEETGPSSGRPIVMIHGAMAWSGTFRPLMDRLGDAGYRAIAIDVPPFGFSERPTTRDYDRRAQAARVGALLDALALEDVVLLGHSFGGGATVEAAMSERDRVTGLVLLAGALGLDELAASDEPPSLPGAIAVAPIRNALVATIATNPWTTGAILRSMMANDTVVSDERIAVYQRPFGVADLTPSVSDWIATGLFGDEHGRASALEASYRAYTPPALLVWGLDDTVTPVAQGRALSELLPNDERVELDHVGHIPHVEDLDRVSAAIVTWLSR